MDDEIRFLAIEEVMALHRRAIARYSPGESVAIRDRGLLESAVMGPQQTFGGEFLHPSLSAMAAAYLIGLARNHAFENGNKRVALATCSTFLQLNGYRLTLDQDEVVELTLNVVDHLWDQERVVDLLDARIEPL